MSPDKMPIKAVLFDMFDTLVLIERNHAFYSPSLKRAHSYLKEKGVETTFRDFEKAYVEARDALYVKADSEMGEPHFNLRIANALRSLGYDYNVRSQVVRGATNAFCESFMNFVRIDDNAKDSLKNLHGKYKLGLVSNFAIPECVTALLQKHGLDSFFDIVVVSGAVNKRKPSPEIYKKALEALDVDPGETVFVGDTVDADVEGPKDVGMKTVYIERRKQEDAKGACPDQTIKNLSELSNALEQCQD